MDLQIAIRVAHAPEGSAVQAGRVFLASGRQIVVGRSVAADVRVGDPTVSREHVRIVEDPSGLAIESITSSATFVDGEPLAKGDTIVCTGITQLQLGAVLLEVEPSAETQPYRDGPIISAQGVPVGTPFLQVIWDSGECEVRVDGKRLPLPPLTARVLGGLCEFPAVTVSTEELGDLAGPESNVGQQVSYARRAFLDLLEADAMDRSRLRALIAEVASDSDLDEIDDAELTRRLIRVKRGVGYILCVPEHEVSHP